MERRKFVGGALTVGAVGAIPVAADAQSKRVPRGGPFVQLDRRLDAVEDQLASGEFEQIRIDALRGPDRLLFGPTDDCTVEVDPQGPEGLMLRDPNGIRILNPKDEGANSLLFGPTQDCRISVDPNGPSGLQLADPDGIRLLSPVPGGAPSLLFGPTDECSIGIDPQFTGLVERDPIGRVE